MRVAVSLVAVLLGAGAVEVNLTALGEVVKIDHKKGVMWVDSQTGGGLVKVKVDKKTKIATVADPTEEGAKPEKRMWEDVKKGQTVRCEYSSDTNLASEIAIFGD